MSLHALVVPAYTSMLRNLAAELTRGAEWAKANGMSEADFLGARLAPDMFPLSTQVNFACHQAQDAISRLKGETPPAPAEESTLTTLHALIGKSLQTLEGVKPSDIDGAADRTIRMDLPNGMVFEMTGFEFVRDWSQAQFSFHRMTAYAIMRHLGVPLGKADYVAHMRTYAKVPG